MKKLTLLVGVMLALGFAGSAPAAEFAFHGDLNHRGAAYTEMPIPGTFVIDRHATIRLAHVDPDYTQRLEPADILETLQTLKGTAA